MGIKVNIFGLIPEIITPGNKTLKRVPFNS